MSVIDTLVNVYNEHPKKDFDFELGQSVRVLQSLTVNVHAIMDRLGTYGTIVNRYTTGLHKDNKYELKFEDGRIETFDETELDGRCKKVIK